MEKNEKAKGMSKADRVREELTQELKMEGKTDEEIEALFKVFGV